MIRTSNLAPWRWREKPLRMVWRIEKDGKRWYLVGTAHFFPYSFAASLKRLIQNVDLALFEGPLDEESMRRIAEHGRQGNHQPPLAEMLEAEVLEELDWRISRCLADSGADDLYRLIQPNQPGYFETYTQSMRPWMAFFSVWSFCLNWKYSVDMQGFQIARKLKRKIGFLETLDEQLAVLDGIPVERILSQLNDVKNWKTYSENYTRCFLEGDLEKLLALSRRFPTRGANIISDRDKALFERMKQRFDEGPAAAFVGIPHVPGVSAQFRAAGYRVVQGFE